MANMIQNVAKEGGGGGGGGWGRAVCHGLLNHPGGVEKCIQLLNANKPEISKLLTLFIIFHFFL